jgi:hypothetical protein
VRTTLRLILARQQRLEEQRREAGETPQNSPPAGKAE